jgi:hypothetical protein
LSLFVVYWQDKRQAYLCSRRVSLTTNCRKIWKRQIIHGNRITETKILRKFRKYKQHRKSWGEIKIETQENDKIKGRINCVLGCINHFAIFKFPSNTERLQNKSCQNDNSTFYMCRKFDFWPQGNTVRAGVMRHFAMSEIYGLCSLHQYSFYSLYAL